MRTWREDGSVVTTNPARLTWSSRSSNVNSWAIPAKKHVSIIICPCPLSISLDEWHHQRALALYDETGPVSAMESATLTRGTTSGMGRTRRARDLARAIEVGPALLERARVAASDVVGAGITNHARRRLSGMPEPAIHRAGHRLAVPGVQRLLRPNSRHRPRRGEITSKRPRDRRLLFREARFAGFSKTRPAPAAARKNGDLLFGNSIPG